VYGLTVLTPPAVEPVSLDEAKLHLRVDHDAEDGAIAAWIAAARELTERHTGRRWVEQTLRLTLPGWPCDRGAVRIPVEPVTAVGAVRYYATGGTLTTLAAGADYQTWLDHSPPLVAPAPNGYWPAVQTGRLGAVQVEFTAGYGADAAAVPGMARSAVLLALAYWYENRGDGNDPTMAINGLPQTLGLTPGAKRLLDLLSTGGYC
jgi:uncharacterized phiE125 gp8 family phage protein